ncbi:SEC-C motif domain-containing protein [Neobacillus bataviensis LMG 21833]|uniref:SEC-C motif domain-containing protein n=1 Tax=Neobacillus bataviensis LMG 21833 TaxID=1117379 RepID=K6DPE8_9BACI|nr:hypothetical protein [Neobacillus bataviensis]EKN62671.1 SEC-C motif domain-containing protein [Neobacillus bataviensis LMG 21833]
MKNICDEKKPQVTVAIKYFKNPKEHEDMVKNLEIGAKFDMRHRGHFLFYGKDFITYKLERPYDNDRNEFLRILSNFMSNILEDQCPSSWKKCKRPFWEELIFTHLPHVMRITPDQKQVETFLSQLKMFIQWLDKRVGTTWSPIVDKYSKEAVSDLKMAEHVLNALFLKDFPQLHQKDFSLKQDFEKIEQNFEQYTKTLDSLFEVTSIIDQITVLTEFNSNRTYYVKGLPTHLIVPGLIMIGGIGRKSGTLLWEWFQTEGIYPQKGRKYLKLI